MDGSTRPAARVANATDEQGATRPHVSSDAVSRISARFDAADPKWHRLYAELKRRYPKTEDQA